jgi:small subunit ribosomal protein S16
MGNSWKYYDPNQNPAEVILKEERVRQWLAKGAKPTLTVSQLLEKKGIRV